MEGKVDLHMSSVGWPNLESHVFHGFGSSPARFGEDFRPRASLRGNVQMTRRAYKLLAVLIKSNSEAEVG